MVVEYVRYTIPAERGGEFEAAYARAQAALRNAPECLRYELARCAEDATAWVLRLEWRSLEAHLSGFRAGPHFAPFFAAVRPFVDCIAEMRHYEVTSAWSAA